MSLAPSTSSNILPSHDVNNDPYLLNFKYPYNKLSSLLYGHLRGK